MTTKFCVLLIVRWITVVEAAAPVFIPTSRTIEVTENLIIGGNVLTLTANDADGDTIAYSLATVNPQYADGVFHVAVTGEITTKVALDYETDRKYTLVVRAIAKGEVAEQTITINVLNVNEAPMFEGQITGATAPNYATGGMISLSEMFEGQITGDTGLNCAIAGMISVSEMFGGQITRARHCPYLCCRRNYFRVVQITEATGPNFATGGTVCMISLSEMFEGQINGATALNCATEGYVVTTVTALDPDLTTDILYTITDGNEEGHFAIHQTAGVVSVAPGQMLNRTIISAYALSIEAADEGQPPKTGTTTLIIGICNHSVTLNSSTIEIIFMLVFIFLTGM